MFYDILRFGPCWIPKLKHNFLQISSYVSIYIRYIIYFIIRWFLFFVLTTINIICNLQLCMNIMCVEKNAKKPRYVTLFFHRRASISWLTLARIEFCLEQIRNNTIVSTIGAVPTVVPFDIPTTKYKLRFCLVKKVLLWISMWRSAIRFL